MSDRPPIFGVPGPVKNAPKRFSAALSLEGYEVIDHDGRPVRGCYSRAEAERCADDLNEAVYSGTLAARLETL